MPKLENVIIIFNCNFCSKPISEMSAQDLMEAGIEGPPYCDCEKDPDDKPLNVVGVYIKR